MEYADNSRTWFAINYIGNLKVWNINKNSVYWCKRILMYLQNFNCFDRFDAYSYIFGWEDSNNHDTVFSGFFWPNPFELFWLLFFLLLVFHSCFIRLIFSRFLDLRGNLENSPMDWPLKSDYISLLFYRGVFRTL